MRLLYSSTIKYPSKLANRYQVVAMGKAFDALLGENFFLGVRKVEHKEKLGIQNIITFTGSPKSFLLAFRYALFIIKNLITHVYSRNDKLLFFIMLYLSVLSRKPYHYIFELHTVPNHVGFFLKTVLQKAHIIVVVTSFIKKDIIGMGISEEKILILPDGVDIQSFVALRKHSKSGLREKLNLPENKKIITYVGTFRTMGMSKGVEELILCFPKVLEREPNAFLLLVGFQEEEVEEVRALLRASKISDNSTSVITFVPQEQAHAYMVASNVLVMNFPWTKHYAYYMSPMKMFEYMASGVPIIATDLPSVREILNKENAVIIEPGNSRELRDSVVRLLHEQDFSQRLAARALEASRKYSWGNRAKSILEFLYLQ